MNLQQHTTTMTAAPTHPAEHPQSPGPAVDLTDIGSMIHALYRAISGPAGAPRDWPTDRGLHHPSALLMPTRPAPEGKSSVEMLSMDGYIASRTPYFAVNDFFEVEVGRREFRFGNIASVHSAYESRRTPDGPPFGRGVNCFHFWWDGDRWWIMATIWDNEREGLCVPESLLNRETGDVRRKT